MINGEWLRILLKECDSLLGTCLCLDEDAQRVETWRDGNRE